MQLSNMPRKSGKTHLKRGICLNAFAPVRSGPSHQSEMVSQLLFGEQCRVMETRAGWALVECTYDQYQGWVAENQVTMTDQEQFLHCIDGPQVVVLDKIAEVNDTASRRALLIGAGSTLYPSGDGEMALNDKTYVWEKVTLAPAGKATPHDLTRHAMAFEHVPYLWGGRSAFGVDCSGFCQTVCKMSGIWIPRDSQEQSECGENVHLLHEAREGDLLFFGDVEDTISHVGLYLGNHRLIHAFGRVRIDTVDHQGIFNSEVQRYTHSLRLIKRLV